MVRAYSLLRASLVAFGVAADTQYKSRPDLSPPRLNITIPADQDVAPGYIFVCPYSGFVRGNGFDGPEQPAGYILRNDGDLVWSSMGYLSGWVGNMQVRTWKGQPVITAFQGTLDSFHGHGFGHPTLLNQNYENIRDLHGGNHKIISIHEFNVLNSGTALVEIYQPTVMDLRPYGGAPDSTWIVDAIFQEIDVATGELLFEWSSLDHVDPSQSVVPLPTGHAGDGQNSTSAWDYFHINSVDKDNEGNYLISARHASALYKINGRTGEIMWQLGGEKSDFAYTDDLLFGFQHDARFLSSSTSGPGIEFVSVFDNAARANGHRGGGIEVVHSKSRAKLIRLDSHNWSASLEQSLISPDGLSAPSQGNVQMLPNSNLFVNWGQAGALTEYRAGDGKAIFNAYLDSDDIGQGVQSYRGFRFEWKGVPREVPAIVSLEDEDGYVTVYVSWNGDTETHRWRFYLVSVACTPGRDLPCHGRYLGQSERVSFETSFSFRPRRVSGAPSDEPTVYAEAIDHEGRVLATTSAAPPQKRVVKSMYTKNSGTQRTIELK